MSQSPSSSKSPNPSNLRFQRRTSEREYYEGAFKPGRTSSITNPNTDNITNPHTDNITDTTTTHTKMDYSQAINQDSDHPAGSSPWATGSPQHARESFGSSTNNTNSHVPSSPYGRSSVDHMDRPSTDTSTSTTNTTNGHPPTSPRQHSQPQSYSQQQQQSQSYSQQQQPQSYSQHQPQSYPQQQPPAQHYGYPQRQYSHQQDNNQPQRYHGNPRLQAQVQQQQQQQPPRPPTQYKLQLKITGLERSGRKDAVFVFDAQTNLPRFRTTQFRGVRRTHSEIQKYADHLISANPDAFVPAVPPPVTSAGVGTDEDDIRVKAAMQRWLNIIATNQVLMRDEETVFFIESDTGYSPVVRLKQPATGVRRKYIKQFAPPPDDTPDLLEARPVVKSFYLGTMESGQKVDKLVKSRRALGLAESDFGVKMGQMQVQETHPGLANAYRKLGKVIQSVGDFHAAQGTAEATTLADPLQYHSSDAFIVKETLTNRHILLRELLQATQTTRSKTSAADRLKASSSVKRDKVDEAIAALDEARTHEQDLRQRCERVTQNLNQERTKWFARTAADVRAAIREYVIREIEFERRTLATLEQVRPDVRNIDASGGLSRLGRESHPVVRRTSLASSQGPKGDAWSGVPRRPDGLSRSISGSFAGATVAEEPEVEESEEGADGAGGAGAASTGRKRAVSAASSLARVEEDDEDRIDARNAASRLAQTTF